MCNYNVIYGSQGGMPRPCHWTPPALSCIVPLPTLRLAPRRPSLASSPTNLVLLPYQQLAMISMPVPDPSMPLPTSRGPLTSVQVDDHRALLHAAELLAALFRRTLAEAPLMTRENLGVWLDWHTRLEGLMVRGLTTSSDVSSVDRRDFPRLLVARTRLSLFVFVSQSPYSVRFVALNI